MKVCYWSLSWGGRGGEEEEKKEEEGEDDDDDDILDTEIEKDMITKLMDNHVRMIGKENISGYQK